MVEAHFEDLLATYCKSFDSSFSLVVVALLLAEPNRHQNSDRLLG